MKPKHRQAIEKIKEADELLEQAESLLADHASAETCRHRRDDLSDLIEELTPESGH
jgi:hypothetical protein